VEGVSRFSALLDANFDAMHGSFASILRLMVVFGEFFLVVKSFSIIRMLFGSISSFKQWIARLLLGGTILLPSSNNIMTNSGNALNNSGFSENMNADIKTFTQQHTAKHKTISFIIILLTLTCSVPVLFVKLWTLLKRRAAEPKLLEDPQLEKEWGQQGQAIVQAKYDFMGETENDLSFRRGEMITVLDKPFPDWWQGQTQDGRMGLFPANFVDQQSQNQQEASSSFPLYNNQQGNLMAS